MKQVLSDLQILRFLRLRLRWPPHRGQLFPPSSLRFRQCRTSWLWTRRAVAPASVGAVEGKGRINLARAQWHFDTKFQFAPPGAPCFPGLLEEFIDATRAAVHTAVHAHALADEELSAVFSRVLRFLWGTVAPASGGAIRLCRTWRGRVELTWRGRSRFDTKFRVTPRGAPRLDDVSVGCAAGSGAEFRFSPLALGHFSASCFGVHLRGLHVSEVS
jgi:hypothetical protein